MEFNTILRGNALDVLKTIESETIDCCVTSPPYYALRDYGTGIWVGGDPDCKHENAIIAIQSKGGSEKQQTNKGSVVYGTLKVCPDCGAVRHDDQIGLEQTPEQFIEKLANVFDEVKRVLKPDGTLWVNIGDSYAQNTTGYIIVPDDCKLKDLIGVPWMLAFELRRRGWYLRQDIIWAKPNPMPESVKDRCTKSHEYIFLLSKQQHYYFDNEAIQEPANTQTPGNIRFGGNKYGNNDDPHFATKSGNVWDPERIVGMITRNKRDVWTVATKPISEAHFATYPEKLIEPCILAGCRPGGVVLDPFFGSGTTGRVAIQHGRQYLGIELNPEYIDLARKRTGNVQLSMLTELTK